MSIENATKVKMAINSWSEYVFIFCARRSASSLGSEGGGCIQSAFSLHYTCSACSYGT